MLLKKISFLALIIIASLTACKKDSTSTDNAVLLTTGKWKLTAETTGTIDTYKNYGACEKDDTWTFGADGKLTLDEGATKCSASDPQTSVGAWAFSGAEKKKLIITASGFAVTVDIVTLDASTLKWSETDASTKIVTTQTFSR